MKYLIITIAAVVLVRCGHQFQTSQFTRPPKRETSKPLKHHLAAGTDVNAKDEKGLPPLHFAVLEGRYEIAGLLIAKGADMNAKNDGGETPLDGADGKIADLLRKVGAKTPEELKAEGK